MARGGCPGAGNICTALGRREALGHMVPPLTITPRGRVIIPSEQIRKDGEAQGGWVRIATKLPAGCEGRFPHPRGGSGEEARAVNWCPEGEVRQDCNKGL